MIFRSALFAAALLCASAAHADVSPTPAASPTPVASPTSEPPPTLDPKEEASLQSFGVEHPECREWNDGCSTCLRDVATKCSTPGIACLPGPIVCSKSP